MSEQITKITNLTGFNVAALRDFLPPSRQDVVTIGATVATFRMSQAEAVALVKDMMQRAATMHGTRHHPYRSFHAVLAKLEKLPS
ncbi:MAG TPA: hypothetical protein VFX53_05070 [Pedococcus sp.]|nr:hypothetical protein [Pedococcus sp.]